MRSLDFSINALDELIAKDFNHKVLEKTSNGYELGINENNKLYIAFPGESASNPHMYLGEANEKNISSAKNMLHKFKNIHNSIDKLARDAYTVKILKADDPEAKRHGYGIYEGNKLIETCESWDEAVRRKKELESGKD